MSLLADISSGNTGFGDVMFLVGFILAVIAAIAAAPVPNNSASPWSATLGWLALAALGLGWLVL